MLLLSRSFFTQKFIMKKYLILSFVCFLITEVYSQSEFRTKNVYYPIEVDTSLDGVWESNDSTDVADSVYLFKTGIPDHGDLGEITSDGEFDLELKMKSLWYGTKAYFLFRHLDDSLVNGYINDTTLDNSLKPGLENRDATALYFFLDSSDTRFDTDANMYIDSSYIDSVAWIRWVWTGTDEFEFEGQLKGDSISSIEDLGGEIIQWEEGIYRYTKLSVDFGSFSSLYDTLEYKKLGFEFELDENDKELLQPDGSYGIQTRAFWGSDLDSAALETRNIAKWGWLYFTYGDTCTACIEEPAFIKKSTANFANVYPNPASDYINIQLDSYGEVQYRIFNIMGQMIKTGILVGREEQVELNNMNSGTYYLQLIDEKGRLNSNKLLIIR